MATEPLSTVTPPSIPAGNKRIGFQEAHRKQNFLKILFHLEKILW